MAVITVFNCRLYFHIKKNVIAVYNENPLYPSKYWHIVFNVQYNNSYWLIMNAIVFYTGCSKLTKEIYMKYT